MKISVSANAKSVSSAINKLYYLIVQLARSVYEILYLLSINITGLSAIVISLRNTLLLNCAKGLLSCNSETIYLSFARKAFWQFYPTLHLLYPLKVSPDLKTKDFNIFDTNAVRFHHKSYNDQTIESAIWGQSLAIAFLAALAEDDK